mgnify:CR=1 FL=1
MKDKMQRFTFSIIWVYFCCYFLQIFDLQNEMVLIIGACLSLLVVIQQKLIRVDLGICLLAITLVSYYFIINGVQGLKYSILYIPLVVYVLANYMTSGLEKNEELNKKIIWMFTALIIGFTVYGILNSYMWYAGYVVPGTRRWEDFWSHEIVPGTQHTAYFLPLLAIFFPAIVSFGQKKWQTFFVLMLTVFFCYTSLTTRSRMPLLIFVIVVFVQLLLFVFLECEKVIRIATNIKSWIALLVFVALIILGFIMVKDTPVVTTFINNMGKDGGIINNARFIAQRQAIEQLLDYPLGGRQMEMILGNFCHNTWLDMANAAGIIPFFAFTTYTFYSLYELIGLLRKKFFSTEVKLWAVGLYVVFFLYFTVEPAIDASIHLVTPWIFVNGIIHGVVSATRNI